MFDRLLLLLLAIGTAYVHAENYVLCTDSSSDSGDGNNLAAYLTSQINDDTWTVIHAESASGCRTHLKNGEAHLYETDAGKSYGIVLDSTMNVDSWTNGYVKVIGKVGSGYTTMAVAREDYMIAQNVETFCDIVDDGNFRVSHTGYMKSAGWISPMGHVQACAVSRPSLQNACKDLTQTGISCHQTAFGNSCVPGAPDTQTGDGACAQCQFAASSGIDNGTCDSASLYYNYFGAAKCLLDGNCDMAFVKTSTMNCPSGGHCLNVPVVGISDSKSVYAKGYDVDVNTFVAVPGYGMYVPGHLALASGLSESSYAALEQALTLNGEYYGGDAFTPITTNRGASETADDFMKRLLGNNFVESMRNMPYFFEQNDLTRPGELLLADYAEGSQTNDEDSNNSSSTTTALAVVFGILAVVFIVVGVTLVVMERRGSPLFYTPLSSGPEQKQQGSIVLPATHV